ncbi:acetyl-CoA carboxylase biotin carboxyl carrier protein [Shouchella shacheensis]|uniref:acetyl-CoA carboxylase biotin carboxyl carrier protein n=1 Tax=Shouchella shacheensis TaxID=1649580 RepID=UPI00073FF183|nr:acetyl-CoA carboxylase biotin carboxyl carrier protein [Shouchella shacheensis]
MLNVEEIKSLIEALDQSSVDELEYEEDKTKITLRKHQIQSQTPVSVVQESNSTVQPQVQKEAPAAPAAQEEVLVEEPADSSNLYTVTSPMVGTFYAAPSPDTDPYVSEGAKVEEETVVCIVEAMKLMNPIVADVQGEIVEIVAQNGELVEYGQPLMVVKL